MLTENIIELLLQLRVNKKSIVVTQDFVNAPCPLAFFLHKRGEDRHPSFGVKISESSSYYFCFTCSPYPQNLIKLVHNYWLMHGEYPFEATKILLCEQFSAPGGSPKDVWENRREVPKKLPLFVINQFPKLQNSNDYKATQCKRYLERRGISPWAYNYCGVRYDKRYGCLIFPLTDCKGDIYMLRARSIVKKVMWTISPEFLKVEYKFPRLTDIGVFFGSHLVDRASPLMIVEGEIDAMRLMSLGYFNVVASATSAITKEQIFAINAGVVLLGMDSDKAGRKANAYISEFLKGKSILSIVEWDSVGRKDAGELKDSFELKKVFKNLRST